MPGPSQPPPLTVQTTLKGHKGPVHVARYSKGASAYVLSGGQDRSVRLWNASTGNLVKEFNAHGYEILGLDIAHDNGKFASCGGDRSVFLWDVATGVTTRRLAGHLSKIYCVQFNEDASVVASGSYDSTVRLYDLRSLGSSKPIQVLQEAKDAVQSIYLGTTYITTGSVDGVCRTYDLRMGELRTDFIGRPITSITPTRDSSTFLITTLATSEATPDTTSGSGTLGTEAVLLLLDSSTGSSLSLFRGHKNVSYRCRGCFGFNEEYVVIGDEDGHIWAWNVVDAKPLPRSHEKAHEKPITWTEYRPFQEDSQDKANEMITASADGLVKVWRDATP